jgi:ATP synthase F1 complex assembly factor 1
LCYRTNPDEFQSRVDELEEKKKAEEEEQRKQLEELRKQQTRQTKEKTLNDIMKVDLLQEKTAEEITTIWKDYHKEKDCIFAAIPVSDGLKGNISCYFT